MFKILIINLLNAQNNFGQDGRWHIISGIARNRFYISNATDLISIQ